MAGNLFFPVQESIIRLRCPEAYKGVDERAGRVHYQTEEGLTALAVWCGGNELQDEAGMPLSEEHPLLQVMGEQVKRLDRDRKWLPTSPSGGVFPQFL